MVREDIVAELITKLVTKVHGEPRQGDVDLLEQELADKEIKLKLQKMW